MAEIELRAVVCTRRLSDEKCTNAEKNLHKKLQKFEDKTSKNVNKLNNMDSVVFMDEKCVFMREGSSRSKSNVGHIQEDFDDEGIRSMNSMEGSDTGSDGDRKKRCCDRYDSSESSDSGVVVLSSTDCSSSSSSSSACSGHSDITSDPGSPYSSPTSAALCSPDPSSEESEDSPSPSALVIDEDPCLQIDEEPRPPDPDWHPYDDESTTCRTTKKRPFPFINSTSTPKLFRTNSGNTGTSTTNHNNNNNNNNKNTTSLIPYQPVNLNNTHQKQSFQKLESKINNNIDIQQQQQQQQQIPPGQQKWSISNNKNNLNADAIKGQGKITEYFKTQIKSTLPTQKTTPLCKKSVTQGQQKCSVKKEGIDKFLRLYSGNSAPTAKQMCVTPVLVSDKESRSKIRNLFCDVEPKRSNSDEKSSEEKPSTGEERCNQRLSLEEDDGKSGGVLSLFSSSVLLEKEVCIRRVSVDEDEARVKMVTTTEKTTVHVIDVNENKSCEEVATPDAANKTENAAPLSPILSVPRVIRFPVAQQNQSGSSETPALSVRCCWVQCNLEFACTSKLLEHIQSHHVHTQRIKENFVCLWVGCKVHDRPSCSLSWLERHVLTHSGNKPFRCIVDGCGQKFSSQNSLERHVNSHFNAPSGINGNGKESNGTRRSIDTITNKLFKRNGKKLRYRRQPWSARMFDYIDTGMMEGVQHRLLTFNTQQMGNVTTVEQEQEISQGNHLALRSKVLARRTEMDGTQKVLVHWLPEDILPDEWISAKEVKASKLVPLTSLAPSAAAKLHHSLLPPNSKATRKPRKPVSRAVSSTPPVRRSS